ncbi:MAG: hypothetical protein KKB79_02295 [Nanoarchaeota archaeon]|nr:hypothetical protein [Nanoarchaeota archaeon]
MVQKNAFGEDGHLEEEFQKLVKKHKIKNIVETGTFMGDTTKEFSKLVDNVYTIESNKDFYLNSERNLKCHENIKIFLGNSPDVLREILPNLKGKTLFFLDAHWGDYWPILDELNEISKINSLSKSIIVIHDFYVPGKDFGFDSYYNSNSAIELFLKKCLGFLGKILKMNLTSKQRLDLSFIEASIKRINPNYKYYYNSKAEGGKRGVIFIYF